jgi:hypothetical protein
VQHTIIYILQGESGTCDTTLGVGFDSNSKWFSNGQYWVCFRIEYSNRIEYFIRTVIVYVYVDSPSQARRKVRDSTYALRTSKNIRFEFEPIFECRKIRKTLKFSNFKSNILSNPTPTQHTSYRLNCKQGAFLQIKH